MLKMLEEKREISRQQMANAISFGKYKDGGIHV